LYGKVTNIQQVLESTAGSLGYELVHHELAQGGRLLRVFIERTDAAEGGARAAITHADCERVTRQLQRVLEVEGIEYERLEVSSPGLDRALKKPADFQRFAGERAEVRLRVPLNGRRNFVGVVRGASADELDLEVDGALMSFAFVNVDRARLVPRLWRGKQ
jgi:ribosome maturation factor RimP